MNNKDMQSRLKVGIAPTLNQDLDPGLGKWWMHVWDLKADAVFCRAYGDSPEAARENAKSIAAALAELERRNQQPERDRS